MSSEPVRYISIDITGYNETKTYHVGKTCKQAMKFEIEKSGI